MDYARARRVKLWGHARLTDDAAVIARLMPAGYKARPEQALLFKVDAWDTNCPQHIPRKVNLANVTALLSQRDERIRELEAQLAEHRSPPVAAAPPSDGDSAHDR